MGAASSRRRTGALRLMFTGDLILDEPRPRRFFTRARAALAGADVLIGHVEVPHTKARSIATSGVPAPPAKPRHLSTLAWAGFDAVTLAGNHIFDCGARGVTDTVASLRRLGIATSGAGATLDAASAPAIIRRRGRTIGLLSYNSVGPTASWAANDKAGCAYVRIVHRGSGQPATPGDTASRDALAHPEDLAVLTRQIAMLARRVDLVIVALHKGIVHTPAVLAPYERPLAHAAVDAGADIVVGHHAHITRGIEVYKGRPIFHGLGNFVTVTRALSVENNPNPQRRAWAERRRTLFGFEPDPDYPMYPFHPESRNAMIAVVDAGARGRLRCGFIPCRIDGPGVVVPHADDAQGRAVAGYIESITRRAGLATSFSFEDGVVWCRA